jgi:hypothetical protein
VDVPQSRYPGNYFCSILSPAGDRMAHLIYFSESEAKAVLITDTAGGNGRIVYEYLYPLRDTKHGRQEEPWYGFMAWTPRGDALAFWRGERGENGLCLLPVPGSVPPPVLRVSNR